MKNLETKMEGESKDSFLEKAEWLVELWGERRGADYLKTSKKLDGKRIAAVVWGTENGRSYGFDTVYLVWKPKNKEMQIKELINSRDTKDNIFIDKIYESGEYIAVKVSSLGSYSGYPWNKIIYMGKEHLKKCSIEKEK